MDEYIKREEAIRYLLNDSPEQVCYSRDDAADCIRYMGAANVFPVRNGRWIKVGYACGENNYQCSECKKTEWRASAYRLKYCPFCGARLMLCDECMHPNGELDDRCDYDSATCTCKHSKDNTV